MVDDGTVRGVRPELDDGVRVRVLGAGAVVTWEKEEP